MNYGVVIPTVGRSGKLAHVLAALAELPQPPSAVAVNDQSDGDEVAAICSDFATKFEIFRCTNRPLGASAARNAAIVAIIDHVEWICTLDDDSKIVSLPSFNREASVIAGSYSASISRVAGVAAKVFTLNRRTVWTHAIESALFLRTSALKQLDMLFDESLGVGSITPWQSGEGTDLLFRLMRFGPVVYDPAFRVAEIELGGVRTAEFPANKHRRYARGTGRVLRRWCPLSDQLRALGGPAFRLLKAGVKGDGRVVGVQWNVLVGRIEGLVGHVVRDIP